ncbi:MAG TPA: hypothetical protein VJS66_08785, partial [Burkholderiales bacterium]|nr:hypothetical protein [Burkholderiales bacterium]
MKKLKTFVVLVSLAALLPSCKSILPPPPVSENSAVVGLTQTARADTEAGQYPNAIAGLERALRIEPKNPKLWQ